jgi:hypothetical protein
MVNVSTVKPNNRCLDSKKDEIEDNELARAARSPHDHDTRLPLLYVITPQSVFF